MLEIWIFGHEGIMQPIIYLYSVTPDALFSKSLLNEMAHVLGIGSPM